MGKQKRETKERNKREKQKRETKERKRRLANEHSLTSNCSKDLCIVRDLEKSTVE
jgi:hypothetical protein